MTSEDVESCRDSLIGWLNRAESLFDQTIKMIDDNHRHIQSENFPYGKMPHSIDDIEHNKHFSLTALVMARKFADVLQKHTNASEAKELNKFIGATNEAKDIRDMHEHSDEYLFGGGKKKDEFIYTKGDISSDMTSTVTDEEGHKLGNKVSIEDIVKEVISLRKYLTKQYT